VLGGRDEGGGHVGCGHGGSSGRAATRMRAASRNNFVKELLARLRVPLPPGPRAPLAR